MFENYLLISKNTRQTLDQYWLTLVVSSSTAEGLGLDADLASVSKPKKMGRPEKVKGNVDFSIFIFLLWTSESRALKFQLFLRTIVKFVCALL